MRRAQIIFLPTQIQLNLLFKPTKKTVVEMSVTIAGRSLGVLLSLTLEIIPLD